MAVKFGLAFGTFVVIAVTIAVLVSLQYINRMREQGCDYYRNEFVYRVPAKCAAHFGITR